MVGHYACPLKFIGITFFLYTLSASEVKFLMLCYFDGNIRTEDKCENSHIMRKIIFAKTLSLCPTVTKGKTAGITSHCWKIGKF